MIIIFRRKKKKFKIEQKTNFFTYFSLNFKKIFPKKKIIKYENENRLRDTCLKKTIQFPFEKKKNLFARHENYKWKQRRDNLQSGAPQYGRNNDDLLGK